MGWRTRPQQGWFLRAESFYNVATYIDDNVSAYFGGQSFHECSHGQSFIGLALTRFHPGGFYLLHEPEGAVSFHGCLRMLRIMHDTLLAVHDRQHSPVLLAYPDATIPAERRRNRRAPLRRRRQRGAVAGLPRLSGSVPPSSCSPTTSRMLRTGRNSGYIDREWRSMMPTRR
jgi:hypothetical protein